ncbi:MAG TPA: TonB C-terminal domain-containing protein [Candidatus Aminicenantes bacterium]|nr:TonB C-terminal domain-containing protein [Candidatus Aminicenantes bacterium]
MTALSESNPVFKKAVVLSFTAHLAFFLFILLSPNLQKSSRGETIHYVELISFPGGGGGGAGSSGGGEEKIAETPLPERETLRDLTTPQKLQQETVPALRHPVEKPEKKTRTKKEKKAVIQKQSTGTKAPEAGSVKEKGTGPGSGIRLGGGSGSSSDTGSAFSSQIGLSNFPFTYYLQLIIDRVSNNWFTSLVDPGISGSFQVTVHFKIYKNGQISELKIEESSGIKSLDLSALRAIQTSASFPPLPGAYEDEYLGIYLIFEHSK